jgi:hypothetical protein
LRAREKISEYHAVCAKDPRYRKSDPFDLPIAIKYGTDPIRLKNYVICDFITPFYVHQIVPKLKEQIPLYDFRLKC